MTGREQHVARSGEATTPVAPATDPCAPRHFVGSGATATILPGSGMPQDRHARIAARRSFVEIKNRFLAAVEPLDGPGGDWLRHQVRQAREPVDLLLLRGLVFSALERAGVSAERSQNELQRAVDNVFPDNAQLQPYDSWR